MPDALTPPPTSTVPNPGIDAAAKDSASGAFQSSNGSTGAGNAGKAAETPAWFEPPLPNGAKRTYLTGGGSAAVAVVFLVFVAILLAYFSSAMSWAPW